MNKEKIFSLNLFAFQVKCLCENGGNFRFCLHRKKTGYAYPHESKKTYTIGETMEELVAGVKNDKGTIFTPFHSDIDPCGCTILKGCDFTVKPKYFTVDQIYYNFWVLQIK